MGWSVGFDPNWRRDIGYGVPSICDHPGCGKEIHRGMAYVCGGEPWGGDDGCGLFFCPDHPGPNRDARQPVCERCAAYADPFEPTPDLPEWVEWKLTDESWGQWRDDNPELVSALRRPTTPTQGADDERV